MSIRRATPSIGRDEYDDPYIHWDDDPDGEFVLYGDHVDAIARVREDERNLFFSQRDRLASEVDKAKIAGWHSGRNEGYAAALRDAVEAEK